MDWQFVGRTQELTSILDAIENGSSILLTGPAGVGKTRLAEEAVGHLSTSHHVERLIGSPSVQQLPFGAVAHLGGDAPLPEPAVLIAFITRALRKRAGSRPVTLVVDDINQLDDGSIAFIEHLLAHESIPVLATARTQGASDPRVVALWKDELIERKTLEPLSREATESLTTSITGGPCAAELHNEVWRLSEGHPLFVREVLLEGLDQSTLIQRDGVWQLDGSLGRSQRVADIVEVRTAHLDDAERDGLRSIALCEPVPLTLARRIAPAAVLESLEIKRMIRVEPTPDGPVIRSSHPMIAEVTVAQMPALTRAAITARLAQVLLESPQVTSNDAMRAALWLLDAGEAPNQDVAIRGARAALRAFDPKLGLRLAEAALAEGPSQEATVLEGRSHAGDGNTSAAVSRLQDAQAMAETEAELASATGALAEVHMFNLGDAPRAVRELEKALESMTKPGPRAELNSQLMLAVGITGDFDLGLRIGPEVADQLDLPPPAQLTSVMAMTLTQSMTGKLDGVMERLERGEALAEQFSDLHPFAPDQVGMNRVLTLHALADLIGADSYGQQRIRSGVGLPGPWLFVTTIGRLFTGEIEGGRRLAAESETYFGEVDPLGIEPMAHGIRALFEAMSGNVAKATELIEKVRSDPRGAPTRAAVWADRAEAWTTAQAGNFEEAAARAVRAGQAALTGTHHVWGAFAFHDAVRLGHASSVASTLRALAGDGRGPLVDLLADHASAAASADTEALGNVASRSLEIGAKALAAEAHAGAAQHVDGPEAARHAHLATHLYDSCDGFLSPFLESIPNPLSNRQREIAALAAAGHPSRAIADQLHLSVRTVDNHLRAVYGILGLAGRGELPALFPT